MKEVCEYALSLCKDADYAEIRHIEAEEYGFSLKNSIPEMSAFEKVDGVAMRIRHKGHMGFFSTNKIERPAIKKFIHDTISMLKKRGRKEKVAFSDEKMVKAQYRVVPKKDPMKVSHEDKLEILKDIDKSLLDLKCDIPSRQLSLGHRTINKMYMNTDGAAVRCTMPETNFFWFITVKEGNEFMQKSLLYQEKRGMEAIDHWNVRHEVPDFAQRLQETIKNGKKSPKGTMSFILGPEVAGISAHESVGHPYEADRILGREAAQAGMSFVKPDMIGHKIGSDIVTVSDDPTLPNSAAYYLYDDEGVKARKRTLIKNGQINEFLHNRETAAIYGVNSNASARASGFEYEPLVRMGNTFIEPGDFKKDEIIADTKEGIYMKHYGEWNIDDIRYNMKYVSLEAYYVKNGQIMYPVKNAALEVTTPTYWSAIDAVANDLEHFAGPCGKGEPMQGIPVFLSGPTIRLKNIKIV